MAEKDEDVPWFGRFHGPNTTRKIGVERRRWRAFARGISEEHRHNGKGRGVVTVGGLNHKYNIGRNSYTVNALLAIAQLRWTGCMLPVELWHDNDPALTSPDAVLRMEEIGLVTLRNFHDFPRGAKAKQYVLTLIALQNTRFAEVLYIDADNIPVTDPTVLFESRPYLATGALFWPDFYIISPWASFWSVLGEEPTFEWSLEVGQMVINVNKHWKTMALTNYFVKHGPRFYFQISHGECELFLLAWFGLRAPYHLAPYVSLAGDVRGGTFCGHTMIQASPELPWQPIFAHRSHDTFSDSGGLRWRALKQFGDLYLAPIVDEGRRTRDTWHQMLKEWAYLVSARFPDSLVTARDLRGGCKMSWLKDQSKCKCIDGVARECWDADSPLADSPEAHEALTRLALIERRTLRLLTAIFDKNASVLRPDWLFYWSSHIVDAQQAASALLAVVP